MDKITNKLNMVKEGMNEGNIIDILGKPRAEKWIEPELLNLPHGIIEKYEKVYIFYYEFDTFMNKISLFKILSLNGIISSIIVFDMKNGKVIAETGRSISDIEMIKFNK